MKKIFLYFICAMLSIEAFAQNKAQDWPNLQRFKNANAQLIGDNSSIDGKKAVKREKRVVFMGNSITEIWASLRPDFFATNKYIGRGISGQTTPQMLIRFKQDVVNIGATTVVILAGTNDIAGNTGESSLEMIMDNISSMCEIARANKIKVILCSVLPAHRYSWSKDKRPDILIPELNKKIEKYAKENKIKYVDFFSAMVDKENPNNSNGLPISLSQDGVHPNDAGYEIMERIIEKYLK